MVVINISCLLFNFHVNQKNRPKKKMNVYNCYDLHGKFSLIRITVNCGCHYLIYPNYNQASYISIHMHQGQPNAGRTTSAIAKIVPALEARIRTIFLASDFTFFESFSRNFILQFFFSSCINLFRFYRFIATTTLSERLLTTSKIWFRTSRNPSLSLSLLELSPRPCKGSDLHQWLSPFPLKHEFSN